MCFFHFNIFERRENLLDSRKSYFADANEAFSYYFELLVDVQFVAIGQLMLDNFEEDFSFNG